MTYRWPDAAHAYVNRESADAPKEIAPTAVCIDADTDSVLMRR